MKSIFLLITISTFFFACNSGNSTASNSYVKKPSDTTQVVGVIELGPQRMLQPMQFMLRITKDTLLPGNDSASLKWKRDTSYIAILGEQLKGKDGKPLLDSLKQPLSRYQLYQLPDSSIWEIYERGTKK